MTRLLKALIGSLLAVVVALVALITYEIIHTDTTHHIPPDKTPPSPPAPN